MIEKHEERLRRINEDNIIQNLIAQANSRYILLNTNERRENFPPYTISDSSLSILAFYYLEIGCLFAENQNLEKAREPLEKGASILEFVHAAESNRQSLSNYYNLISAMSYYVSFQYSKSFILVRKIEADTVISRLVSLFLQRNFAELSYQVSLIIVNEAYSDEFIVQNDTIEDGRDKIYERSIALCLDNFIRYFQTGNENYLTSARERLNTLKEISEIDSEPGIWWVIRLLLLISNGFEVSSLWKALSNYFDIDTQIIDKYIKSLTYLSPRGIYELFITQRLSLNKVLCDDRGCIVTIPTSSGKTRIAEIAIIDSLVKNAGQKILYIAPFRSLAFEVENSLLKLFENLNITLSHLYGGSIFSQLDAMIFEESDVIIATPEKAKAIIRGNRNIAAEIKLVIIDEGHLLGPDKRLIINEIFYEELRFLMTKNSGKFLLLSAVLPNADDLASWLTGSKDTVYKDKWRPSDERLGVLEWDGFNVHLKWESQDKERPAFNNNFIVSEELPLTGRQRKVRRYPNDKREAIAATAYKLKNFGSSLIFVGLKDSVFTMAEAYLKCLGETAAEFEWKNKFDWKCFELASIETYGENNNWLLYAKYGILCHHGALNSDVRIPLERLMRTEKPLAIICTSTLGQGVNLGVSTVIFSTIYQGGEELKPRDFWNIAGRAGRAFVDHEGKILVALDASDKSSIRSLWKIKQERKKILQFFDKEKINVAQSGILTLIMLLKKVTSQNGVSFDILLQLITENKIEQIGENAKGIDEILDWIDDGLLALHDLHNEEGVDYGWVETFFRNSLAFIQIKEDESFSKKDLINFLQARVRGIVQKVNTQNINWQSIITSGIPLNSDLHLENVLDKVIEVVRAFNISEKELSQKITLLNDIIILIKDAPVFAEDLTMIVSTEMIKILQNWIKGTPYSKILHISNADETISELFTYKFPWILNGLSKKLRKINLLDEALTIEELSVLLECGLPSLTCVKIYQAGIRSRLAAVELSNFYEEELWEMTVKEYKNDIIKKADEYKQALSQESSQWIDLLLQFSRNRNMKIDYIEFTFKNVPRSINLLVAKEINNKQYLFSPDYKFYKDVTGTDINFSQINEISGIFFQRVGDEERWQMVAENPHIEVTYK